MIELNVESNIDQVRLQFNNLAWNIEEKATIRALNRAGDQSVTAANREIRRVYTISAAFARRQIRVVNRASKGRLYFTIRIFSRRIPLAEFRPRQTQRGVSVAIKRGSRKLIPRAFLATMPSGHVGVFARIYGKERPDPQFRFGSGSGARKRRWGEPDIPIGELTTLSVPRMFLERTVHAAVKRVARDSFNRNFQQQVNFLRSKAA